MNICYTTGARIVTACAPEKGDHVPMTCREEILIAAGQLKDRRPDGTFSVTEVLDVMHANGTRYLSTTIKGYVVTKMCRNAPQSSATHYQDLERVAPNTYRLV